jgi:glycosyltransferase involved in cell wall biosynthesis
VPEYRVSLFKELSQNKRLDVAVFASPQFENSPDSVVDEPNTYIPCRASSLFNKRLYWQHGIKLPISFCAGDVCVLCGNPRLLSNYPLLFSAKRRKVGLIWWGQGHTPGPPRISEIIRHKVMRLADVLLLYTNAEVDEFVKKGFAVNRVFSTNNTIDTRPIDLAMQFWTRDKLQQFKEKHGLHDKQLFLFCGRLNTKCELEQAFHALHLIRKAHQQVRLLIIGSGPEKDRLVALAWELNIQDCIIWIGTKYDQIDLAPWFLSALAYVYPGSIGLSLNHAMAYGLPVVTHSDKQWHNPEFAFLKNGINGVTYPKDDTAALAKTMVQMITEGARREAMASNAYKFMRTEVSFDAMIANFLRAIECASACKT